MFNIFWILVINNWVIIVILIVILLFKIWDNSFWYCCGGVVLEFWGGDISNWFELVFMIVEVDVRGVGMVVCEVIVVCSEI